MHSAIKAKMIISLKLSLKVEIATDNCSDKDEELFREFIFTGIIYDINDI